MFRVDAGVTLAMTAYPPRALELVAPLLVMVSQVNRPRNWPLGQRLRKQRARDMAADLLGREGKGLAELARVMFAAEGLCPSSLPRNVIAESPSLTQTVTTFLQHRPNTR